VEFIEVPEALRLSSEVLDLAQPVAELEELANGKDDIGIPMPNFWIGQYRQAINEGSAPGYHGMILNGASLKLPRTHLRGILDRVKTGALELALSLEEAEPNAGSVGGPTVSTNPALAETEEAYLALLFRPGASSAT
jgi:hypothetical protein